MEPDEYLKKGIFDSLEAIDDPIKKGKISKTFIDYIESMKKNKKMLIPVFDPLKILEKIDLQNIKFVDVASELKKIRKSKAKTCPICSKLKNK